MRRTLEQFLGIFNSLSASQRITFAAIITLIPAGFLYFAWNGSGSSMVPLSYGKVFAIDEMRNAEQSLKEAGLTRFRSEGRQILAPASDVEKYNAALLQSGSLPSHWAEELEKKLESTNPFLTSPETLKQTRDALLGKHLRRMILASPDVEDADVFWTPAASPRSRFSKDARMKATIVVKPKPGRDLASRQIQAYRDAITYAIPDLKSTDVTVFDSRKGEAYTPDSENDPMSGKTFVLLREASQLYEMRIKKSLSHISPEIVVTVNVEIDPIQRSVSQSTKYDLKKSIEQQQTDQKRTETFRQQPFQAEPGTRSNLPRALASAAANTQNRAVNDSTKTTIRSPGGETTTTEQMPALPKVVTVSILIPEDYYTKALDLQKTAAKSGAPAKTIDAIKAETEQTVKNLVASAIPIDPNNPNPKQITVNSFVPVREDVPEIKPSSVETVTSLVTNWGSAIGIGLFAVWALWMLRGTVAKGTPPESPAASSATEISSAPPETKTEKKVEVPVEQDPIPTLNDRDVVQTMVRENPEMAVAIIGKWLQAAR